MKPPPERFPGEKPGSIALAARGILSILASRPYGTLYIGWTTDLARRVWEHKHKVVPGFTTKYGVDRLVWLENHEDRKAAFRREKQTKGWRRDWKINLIETQNRHWIDLYDNLPDG
jgi:putative endonuclease